MRVLPLLSFLAFALMPAVGRAQDVAFVLGEKNAYGVLGPVVASESNVESLEWSADSQFLVIQRVVLPNAAILDMLQSGFPPPVMPRREVVVFSTRSGKSTVAAQANEPQTINPIGMLGNRLIVQRAGVTQQGLGVSIEAIVPGQRGTTVFEDESLVRPEVSPDGRLLAIPAEVRKLVLIYDVNLRLSREIPITEGNRFMGWASPRHLRFGRVSGTGFKQVSVNVDTGAAVEPLPEGARPSVLRTYSAVERREPRPVPTVWIAATGREDALVDGEKVGVALVTGDGDMPTLSPDGKWLAYRTNSLALVRPVATVDREVFLSLRRAARQAQAMSNAKQVALAAIIYAADNDENMVAGADWQSKLMPYLQNGELMSGFTLLLNGGNLAKLSDPASTPLGFIELPWGRAMAYADGHVKWLPNP